jgi:hypothetical protein
MGGPYDFRKLISPAPTGQAARRHHDNKKGKTQHE